MRDEPGPGDVNEGAVERVGDHVLRVLAPNPGPMTLEGTNTWVVGDPRLGPPLVVDPGPRDHAHRAAVLAACGGRVAGVLLTHRHADHAESAPDLAAATGCAVRAADPDLVIGGTVLVDGDVLVDGGLRITVVATPGHTSDSVCLLVTDPDGVARLLTGDTVLGRGTSVVGRPDGDLRHYLASLERLEDLVRAAGVRELLPGHGPRVADPVERLQAYRRHRRERLDQVRAALTAGDRTPDEVVARVYADVGPELRPAAARSVAAQLAYLAG